MSVTLLSMVGSRKRRRVSIPNADLAQSHRSDFGADLGPQWDVHPAHEEQSLGETHLCVAEAALSLWPQWETYDYCDNHRSYPCASTVRPLYGERTQSGSNSMQTDSAMTRQIPRDWEAVPKALNYNELMIWDSDKEEYTIFINLATVSGYTESLIKEAWTKILPISACLQTRNAFPLP